MKSVAKIPQIFSVVSVLVALQAAFTSSASATCASVSFTPAAASNRSTASQDERIDAATTAQDGDEPKSITVSPQIQAMEMIRAKMQSIATSFERADTSDAMQKTQLDVMAELDRLIAEDAAGQQSAGAASSTQPSDSTAGEPDGSTQQADDGTGQGGGDSSNDRATPDDSRALVEKAWGHLPERMRAAMRSALGEQFLPKYEKLIEAYYKRLANGDPDGP